MTVKKKSFRSSLQSSPDRNARLRQLRDKITQYDPTFDIKELRVAVDWAAASYKSHLPPSTTVDDELSDALSVVELLVEHEKAGRDTILASIMHSAARLSTTVDEVMMATIERRFGHHVFELTQYALQLNFLELLPLTKAVIPLSKRVSQTAEQQNHLYQLMSLWTAIHPHVLLIRGYPRLIKFKKLIEERERIPTRQVDMQYVNETELTVAPNLYVAGYQWLSYELLNLCLRYKAPDVYGEIRKTFGLYKVTDDDLEGIKARLTDFLNEKGFHFFSVEVRRKSPYSARAKMDSRADHFACRVVLSANQENDAKIDIDSLSDREKGRRLQELGHICRKALGYLQKEFGRKSKDRGIREKFRKLAQEALAKKGLVRMPDSSEATTSSDTFVDDRFKDFITKPKKNGYSSLHDAIYIEIKGRLIEFEVQVLDDIRHGDNTYGPSAAHSFYKTGLGDHVDAVLVWRQTARALLNGRPSPAMRYVYVYDDANQIVELRGSSPTVSKFMEKVYGKDLARMITGARIESTNPFSMRNRETHYAPTERLKTGDHVFSIDVQPYDEMAL